MCMHVHARSIRRADSNHKSDTYSHNPERFVIWFVCSKVRNYGRKDYASSTSALTPAAAVGDAVAVGSEDRGTRGWKGGGDTIPEALAWEDGRGCDQDLDERCRETERTLLECGLG